MDCLLLDVPRDTKLVYMDPPFGPVGEDPYFGVGGNRQDYFLYMHARIKHLTKGLENFNFILHMDWRASHYLKCMVDGILGRENFQNEIVWAYSGPSANERHLPRKHNVLLWWGVGEYPYNPLLVPYTDMAEPWHGDALDEVFYKERGKLIEDWWVDIPPFSKSEKGGKSYPTQKPLKLLNRVVSMFSDPGDLVLDPMMGSGVAGYAAVGQKRRFLGCDVVTFAAS